MLDSALSKLKRYSQELGVADVIITEESDIGEYVVQPNYFDYILAVSSLERVESESILVEVLTNMARGTKLNVLVKQLEFEIVRNERPTLLKSDCITFAVQRSNKGVIK